ncbi:MAG: caspase family protein, partial [Microvirga sp.]
MPLHTLLLHRNLARLRIAIHLLAAMTATLLSLGAGAALAAERVALIMVAEDYQKLQKSSIGAKRANDIAEALKGLGFTVMVSTNPTNSGARAFLKDFSGHVADADLALVVLAGHSTAAGGQSFFLPVNAEIGRSTDLLSRGISITAVTQIVSRAKAGGVIVLMTAPNFPSPVDGLDGRPEFTAEIAGNVVTVFSSSSKVPISNVDSTSEQAAEALARALRRPDPTFPEAIKAAAKDIGVVFGKPAEISLAKPPEPAIQEAPPAQQDEAAAAAQAAVDAQ